MDIQFVADAVSELTNVRTVGQISEKNWEITI